MCSEQRAVSEVGLWWASRWRKRSDGDCVESLMRSLWRVNVGYVFGEMKGLKGRDRWIGGSISLKLAQVPVYLQDGWRWWRLQTGLPALTILTDLVAVKLKELLSGVSMDLL